MLVRVVVVWPVSQRLECRPGKVSVRYLLNPIVELVELCLNLRRIALGGLGVGVPADHLG